MSDAPPAITLASHLRRFDQVLAQEVGSEAVLLNLASEQYFGLNPVGVRIWALLPECADLGAIHLRLCEEYDADPGQIETDLLALASSLLEAGLVVRA